MDRVMWNGTAGVFVDDEDISDSWQNTSLSGEEGAKLTLLMINVVDYETLIDESTFYGDDVQTPITLSGDTSKIINIEADTEDAVSTSIRVTIA